MRACGSAGGGVMFIPDEIERKAEKVSYKEIAAAPEAVQKPERTLIQRVLGLGKKQVTDLKEAA